jgi:hypothetical protein
MTAAAAHPSRLPRGRRYAVRAMLLGATILTVASIFALYANRQLLDSDNWADTSSELLAHPAIRGAVSNFLVDQVYANVDVRAEVSDALPTRLKPLAGPAANGLQTLAEKRTDRFLRRPAVQEAWKAANKITAQQFINIAEGKQGAITASGNAVVLDLRLVIVDLARRLGLPGKLVGKIPPTAGKIKVMSADQVTTLQNGASAVRGLAIVLPALALALLAGAVYLARGRRRETLLLAGFGLVIAGALVLIGRNVGGQSVVDSLAKTEAIKPATAATWAIGTDRLREIAQASIIMGIPVILAAWLAGPMGLAVSFRRSTAPWLRERPGVTYGVVSAIVLLVIAWGPIPATRSLVPVLIMIALVITGVEALRRQVALEFPDSTPDDVRASLRAAIAHARGRNGDAHPAANGDRLHELERLSALHDTGSLSDEEFAAEKALLGDGGAAAA